MKMKKDFSLASVLLAALVLFTACKTNVDDKEPMRNDKLPFKTVNLQTDKVLEIIPFTPTENGCESLSLLATSSTAGNVLINDYFEDEIKETSGTHIANETLGIFQKKEYQYDSEKGFLLYNQKHNFMQLMTNDAGKPCVLAEPLFYLSYKIDDEYYFETKDEKNRLELDGYGKGRIKGTYKNSEISYTNVDGVITITYENGESDKLNWYDNNIICFQECIIPCKYLDEMTIAATVIWDTNTKIKFAYQKNYFEEALNILPKQLKKTVILCAYDQNPLFNNTFSEAIITALKNKGENQADIKLLVDPLYKNYVPYELNFKTADLTSDMCKCIVSFKMDNPDSTITGKEIKDNCFSLCTGLKEVSLPANYTTIGADAFNGCTALEKVILEDYSGWAPASGDEQITVDPATNAEMFKDGSVKFTKQ